MDKNELPPGGDPQDDRRTQEIGPVGAQPWQSGQPGGQAWGQQAGQAPPVQGRALSASNSPKPPRRRRALLWGAGLALVALLAGGGAYAATTLSSGSPAGPTGQAAQLNDILNSASSPTSAVAVSSSAKTTAATAAARRPCVARAAKLKAAGHPVAAERVLLLCRDPLARLRLLGGLHGSFTFKTKTGTTTTLAYQRGSIQSVSGSDVVVQSSDGTTWTWVLQSSTVIRQGGKKTTTSALADGEHVFAGGPVVSGAYDAKLIVVQKAQSGSTPSPTPSAASGS